jgi:hypothetical protein
VKDVYSVSSTALNSARDHFCFIVGFHTVVRFPFSLKFVGWRYCVQPFWVCLVERETVQQRSLQAEGALGNSF